MKKILLICIMFLILIITITLLNKQELTVFDKIYKELKANKINYGLIEDKGLNKQQVLKEYKIDLNNTIFDIRKSIIENEASQIILIKTNNELLYKKTLDEYFKNKKNYYKNIDYRTSLIYENYQSLYKEGYLIYISGNNIEEVKNIIIQQIQEE